MRLAEVTATLRRYSDSYLRAYVHGSVAKGTDDEHSDVDLVLIWNTGAAFFDRIREVMELVLELGKVDVLIYAQEEQREMLAEPGRYFLREVFEKWVVIEGTQDRSAALASPSRE
jgi:predicted nucleotidyltransferase